MQGEAEELSTVTPSGMEPGSRRNATKWCNPGHGDGMAMDVTEDTQGQL